MSRWWTRADEDLSEFLFEREPRPWPEPIALHWLRYANGAALHGRIYWVPKDAPGQVRGAMERNEPPGRRALAMVTGWGEKKARLLLEGGAWIDPYQAQSIELAPPVELRAEATMAERKGPTRVPGRGQPGARVGQQSAGATVIAGPWSGPGSGPGYGPDRARFLQTQNPEPRHTTPPNPPAAAGAGCAVEPESVSDRPAPAEATAPVTPSVAAIGDGPVVPPPAHARAPKGLSPAQRATLAATVLEVAGPVEGVAPSVYDGPIRRLHRALGSPDLAGLCLEVALVGRWARESSEPRAARYIRGIGMGGADQSRSVKTLCDPDRWGERLQAARAWAQSKTSTAAASSGPSPAEEAYREACIEALLDGAPEHVMAPAPKGLDAEAVARVRELAGREWVEDMLGSIDWAKLEAARVAWQARAAEETRQQLKAMGLGPGR